jgi:hypothetical protein
MKLASQPIILAIVMLAGAGQAFSAYAQSLPWEREIVLQEAARSVTINNTLNPTDPLPDQNCYPRGKGEPVAVRIDKSNGECLEFSAVAGKRYSLQASGRTVGI